jgi:hypothetical protein
MINVSIFVYGDDGLAKRLELFEDENISINSSIQNINDISKVFTDFSQSFTIPATKTNNAIFKHWYENSLDSAFNATKRKDAYIEIDTLPFRKGKIQLEKASYKKGDIDNYTLTFFGSLISLKDKFNNRFLRDFDYSAYNFTYTGAIVKTRVTGNVGLDVKFPLISSKNVWQYNTNGTDVSNYDISKVGTPISYLDLFPAMRISKILESIATQLGITLSGSFLSNSKFTNAFLWLKNTDTFVQKGSDNRIYFQSKTSTTGTSSIFDLATNVLNFTQPLAPAYVSKNYIDIDFTSGSGITFNFSVYKNGIKVNEQTALTSPSGFPIRLDIAFVDSGAYTFFVSSTSALTFTSVYTFEINSGSGASIDVVATQSTPQTTTTTLNIGDYMPELKAEDFFSGLLKMFNLTCYSFDGITYYVEQLEEWYSAGQTYDISEYCQTDKIDLERVRPYKTFNFNYEECENLLATRFLSQSDIPYGDLKYEIDNDGEEYSIELPFENMPFTKFTDTNLQVGYSIKSDYSGYIPKPVILYDYGVIQTLTSPKTYYFDDGTSSATATTYNLFGQDTLVSSVVSTINWGAEQSTFTNKIEQNSLFQNYYSAYLTNTFNQKARLMKIKALLPIFLLSKLNLNDKIVIRDKRYIINSYQTELTTGETSLELMSDFRAITLGTTTTTTTPTTTTSTTTTTAVPNPTFNLGSITPNCDTNQAGVLLLSSVVNGDRYKVCEGSTFTCTNDGCSNPTGYITSGSANYNTGYINQTANKSYTVRVYNGNNCSAYSDQTMIFFASYCTTTSTTTPRPTFPCESYLNNSGSSRTISYTRCDGVIFQNVNIGVGSSICAQYETLGGTGASFMTFTGECTTTTTSTSTTSTTTTSTTTTTTTTEAPRFTYYRWDVSTFDCSQSNPIPYWSYTSYANGFKIINGDGITRYLTSASHINYTNQINSIINSSCSTTTTTTTTCSPYATYIREFCGGAPDYNKIGVFADGSCGEYTSVIAYNDPACGYTTTTTTTTTTLPPRYTFLRYDVNTGDCSIFNPIPFFATTNYTTGYYFVNGDGIIRYVQRATHSNFTNQINSVIATSCTTTTTTTTTCLPYATYIREFCGGAPDYNKIGVFADGSCGEYQSVIAYNDPACGYTTTTTTTTQPPTTTTSTTTTTTTASVNCQQYTLNNYDQDYSDYYDFQSCNGTWNYNVELQANGNVTICARQGTVTAGGAISVSLPQGSCS